MGELDGLRNSILKLDGKPASCLTNALKTTGGEGGSMIDGLLAIVDFCDDKIQETKLTYGVGGALVGATLVGSGAYIYKKYHNRKLLKKQEKELIKAFDNQAVLFEETEVQCD